MNQNWKIYQNNSLKIKKQIKSKTSYEGKFIRLASICHGLIQHRRNIVHGKPHLFSPRFVTMCICKYLGSICHQINSNAVYLKEESIATYLIAPPTMIRGYYAVTFFFLLSNYLKLPFLILFFSFNIQHHYQELVNDYDI